MNQNITVIAKGDELRYALPFMELFQHYDEKNEKLIKSKRGNKCNIRLYSEQTYLHEAKKDNGLRIEIGNIHLDNLLQNVKPKFSQHGAYYQYKGHYARLLVDMSLININGYDDFYKDVSAVENQYFLDEKEYIEEINKPRLKQLKIRSLHIGVPVKVVEQYYLFLAYKFYIQEIDDILSKYI